VLILSGIFLLFYMLRVKDYWRTHTRLLLAFAAGAAISLAGQMAFFLRNWNIFMGRFGQEGIFFNGWIQHQQAQTGKSVLQILVDQFTGNTLIYIARPAFNNFFNSTQPYLTIVASVLFLLGMAYAFAYVRQPEHFVLLTWFWAVILFGGVLTLNPPAHTRLLMTTPAMSLFTALGLYKLVEYLKKARLDLGRLAIPVFVLIVAVISFQNITYYMFKYRTEYRFQDANGEAAMEIGTSAEQLGPEYNIYVLGDPRFYASFPTITFIAPESQRFDLYSGNIATFELESGQKAAFYASPENYFLLEQVKQKYPGGENGSIYRKSNPGELLLEVYILNQ
jgi:hypothetical protein